MKKTLLTLLATAVALSASAARLTKRQELANRTSDNLVDGTIYDVSANLTLSASAGSSMLRVLSTNVAAINIKKGVTLTLNGGNATGTIGAGAAISVAPQATLYLVGEGTLIANGGAAADGGTGGSGNDAEIDSDAEKVLDMVAAHLADLYFKVFSAQEVLVRTTPDPDLDNTVARVLGLI